MSENLTPRLPASKAHNFIDISEKRFGRWLVVAIHPERYRGRQAMWFCRCDCGTERIVRGTNLRFGSSASCGCFARDRHTKHALAGTRAYHCWYNIKGRCFNSQHPKYLGYGGRGITVCSRWLNFENFYADMGDPPSGMSLDRIANDGNYEPGNCRWATPIEQARNKQPRKRRSTVAELQQYADSLASGRTT